MFDQQPHYLTPSSLHTLAYWDIGPKDGIPFLFLHGGPGSKTKPHHLEILPPHLPIHAILFDQRGCGKSTPLGETRQNTTTHLIADIEKLRIKLKIPSWYIVGSSWGSTLALLYAETYPQKVKGLILKSVFLARKKDLAWIYKPDGAQLFQPDIAEKLNTFFHTHHLNPETIFSYGQKLFSSSNIKKQKKLVSLIFGWEYSLMQFDKPLTPLSEEEVDENMLASARIYFHYAANDFFIKENQILASISSITHLPTIIVHGRYDLVCPPEQAYTLHQALPHSQLFFTNHASHHLGWDGKQLLRHLITALLA